MKLVDSSVIFQLVEFVFNLLNVVVTKHFFVFSYETVKFFPSTLYKTLFFTTCACFINAINAYLLLIAYLSLNAYLLLKGY